jgi:hypothetical protein
MRRPSHVLSLRTQRKNQKRRVFPDKPKLHPADEGDTTTLPKTLETAAENLKKVDAEPTGKAPAACVF